MINKTKEEEILFLNKLRDLIEIKYKTVVESHTSTNQEIAQMKSYFWDNIADMDGAEKNANRMQILDVSVTNENTEMILKGLEKLRKSPYFARIDFQDAKEELLVYIGIRGFRNDVGYETIVYDWRAPVSSLFYDSEIGSASYNAPEGIVEGVVTLKRQYKIVNGHMEYMIESNVGIDDEILQKELSSTSDEKMKNIVATIQKEQNAIIRNEDANVLIIQGAAGSGKTSIALHRIAFMLYRFKHTIQSSDVLILSPNKVFANYISNVLPELGEDHIQEIGFEEIANGILGSKVKFQTFAQQVAYLLDTNDEAMKKRIEYKSSVTFYIELKEYLERFEEDYFKAHDIKLQGIKLSANQIVAFLNKIPKMPLKDKITKMKKDIPSKIKLFFSHKGLEWKAEYVELIKKEIQSMFPFKNANEIYANFYARNNQPHLYQKLEKNKLEYSDVFPLAYTKMFFEKVEDYGYVKHLLIDEMQDYTPIQYAVIKQLFRCKMTILGDAYQAVNPYSAASIGKIRAVFENSKCVTLCKSYRSTIEIAEFAQSISPNPDIIPVERHGERPGVIGLVTNEEQIDAIRKLILEFRQSEYTNIGIICRTSKMADELYRNLQEIEGVHLLDFSSTEFEDGIIITSAHMSKGLEFDQVLIPNVSDEEYQSEMDRKMLYVACTRAMHKLTLSYVGEISKWLKIE